MTFKRDCKLNHNRKIMECSVQNQTDCFLIYFFTQMGCQCRISVYENHLTKKGLRILYGAGSCRVREKLVHLACPGSLFMLILACGELLSWVSFSFLYYFNSKTWESTLNYLEKAAKLYLFKILVHKVFRGSLFQKEFGKNKNVSVCCNQLLYFSTIPCNN